MMDQELLDRYADLIVRFGANVQPGQEVRLLSTVGKQELTRAIATRLYQVGAVFVSVRYGDSHLDRARLDFAVDEALSYEPEWIVQMIRDHGTGHGATIGLSGNPWPGLLEGVDPERIARDHTPGRKELRDNLAKARNNWTLAPAPTEGWAVVVHPDLEPADALARLWEQVIHMCRLDEEDPGGRLGIPDRGAEPGQGDAGGAAPGFAALRRAGHRPDDRAVPGIALARRLPDHRDGSRPSSQPAHRGGLHDARPGTHRGGHPGFAAARARGEHHPRLHAALRGRPVDRGGGGGRR